MSERGSRERKQILIAFNAQERERGMGQIPYTIGHEQVMEEREGRNGVDHLSCATVSKINNGVASRAGFHRINPSRKLDVETVGSSALYVEREKRDSSCTRI